MSQKRDPDQISEVPTETPPPTEDNFGAEEIMGQLELQDPPCTVLGIKLNIGSGSDYKPGYLNIDPHAQNADADWDASHLPLRDNSVAQIVAYEVLEHLPMVTTIQTLNEWNRVLKPEGKVVITVPDFIAAMKKVLDNPEDDWPLATIYGNQSHPGQFHKAGFTPKRLFRVFGLAGFRTIKTAYFKYGSIEGIYCEAVK